MTVKSIGGNEPRNLHAYLDEFISKGAKRAILIAMYDDGVVDEDGDVNEWEAISVGGGHPAEKVYIYQQLTLLAISSDTALKDVDER